MNTVLERQCADLRERIRTLDAAYYGRGVSLVDDNEYDIVYRKLLDLERHHPELRTPDSPTQRVGNDLATAFAKVPHTHPMLSIDNTYEERELDQWFDRIEKLLGSARACTWVAELKMDGVAVALHYDHGVLVRALTRGNGVMGDDVSANVRTIRSVPLRTGWEFPFEVRGEVYLRFDDFEALNDRMLEGGQKPMQNPRNCAAGTLKLLDSREVARRRLSFAAHAILGDGLAPTHHERLASAGEQGFAVVEHSGVLDERTQVLDLCRHWEKARHELPWPVDGVVIKVNEMALRDELGATGRSPRWVCAFKYQPETASTTLRDVVLQVGRTGVVTPVARLEPVSLGGTTVSSATLHNFDEMVRLDVRPADTVEVEKGGEIIPKVVRVLHELRSPGSCPFTPPAQCPSCGTALLRPQGEVALRCPNSARCPAQLHAALLHFVSRTAMDIASLGPALVHQLIDRGLVHSCADLYDLRSVDLAALERMGEKSAATVIAALDASRSRTLDRLLHGLNIRLIGARSAAVLARSVDDISQLYDMDTESLARIDTIGPEMARSIRTFFSLPANRDLVERLRAAGVNCSGTRPVQGAQPLAGASFVLTGTLQGCTREEARARIEAQGGSLSSAVSRKTRYVVAGEHAGSKLSRARELGVTVLDEAQFTALLAGGSTSP